MALPRIWLLSINEPTVLARIKELMHGESQPSPSNDFVPINTCIYPSANNCVTAGIRKCESPTADTFTYSVSGRLPSFENVTVPASPTVFNNASFASAGITMILPHNTPSRMSDHISCASRRRFSKSGSTPSRFTSASRLPIDFSCSFRI